MSNLESREIYLISSSVHDSSLIQNNYPDIKVKVNDSGRSVVFEVFPFEYDAASKALYLTITTDNSSESSQHKMVTKALKGVVLWFADPYASW